MYKISFKYVLRKLLIFTYMYFNIVRKKNKYINNFYIKLFGNMLKLMNI